MNLDKWQGIEQEFRVTARPRRYRHAERIINALQRYNFFDDPEYNAFCSKSYWKNDGFLRNGSRIYICTGGHLEITTPECRNAFEALKYDKAADLYAQIGTERTSLSGEIQCWKANVELDVRYARGTHESYVADKEKFAGKEDLLTPFLILRKIFTGAGGYVLDRDGMRYVISPRSLSVKSVVSNSSSHRPILSSRDEPLTHRDKVRIHVTSGEGVRSDVTRFLNNAMTSYVIEAIESSKIRKLPQLRSPLHTLYELAGEQENWTVELKNGDKTDAIDYLNSFYLPAVEELFEERETDYWDEYALKTYKHIMQKLNAGLIEDPYVYRRVEWAMKRWIIKNKLDEFEFEEDEYGKEVAASFCFTNLCDFDLYEKLADEIGAVKLVSDREIGEALVSPPPNSRALLRLRLAKEFSDALFGWNKIAINPKRKVEVRSVGYEESGELLRTPGIVVVGLEDLYRCVEESNRRMGSLRLLVAGDEEHIRRIIRRYEWLYKKTYSLDDLDWDETKIENKIREIKSDQRENQGD